MQFRGIDNGGLLVRLVRLILAVGVLVASTTGPAHAANLLGIVPDPTFGANGFAPLQPFSGADAGTTIRPIGFARLDVAGGYVAATLQRVAGVERMVLTKFAQNGQPDTAWGAGGSLLPALPAPVSSSGDGVKLVAGRVNGEDIFYLAFNLVAGGNRYVAVARFLGNGAFDTRFGVGGYATSTLPVSAPAGLLNVEGAAFTDVSGEPTLVVALAASGGRLVFTRAHGAGATALSDEGGGASMLVSGVPTIMQMRAFGPNHVEVVGTLDGNALYVDYDAGALTSSWRVFDLPCPTGSGSPEVMIDAVAHPAAFGSDVLVYARMRCVAGMYEVVARIANIASQVQPLGVVWQSTVEIGSACNFGAVACAAMFLAIDDAIPNHALVTSPLSRHYPVRLADGTVRPYGALSQIGTPSPYPRPSAYRGTVLHHSRLVGFGQATAADATPGITSVLVDGLFADGFE
ncbi:MAG TPA: hypothetical protein VJ724_04905 [Tahibacter sp.]|nr:hypothetical protein [Tahibacter sp.]